MRVATMACLGLALAAGLPGDPARADGTVKIGFINTLSGANAALGQDALDGLSLVIEKGQVVWQGDAATLRADPGIARRHMAVA